MLAEGHLLIEDVPGVGKTKLAKALARSIDCTVRRIQFTPDLLPSDVTGVSVYNQETRDFEFKPGAIFANIVVGDEINRASPKTQSALLECMEERQVTVDGMTYELQMPFMVIATQNPIEMEGTYPLPEAQRDRFTARIAMGYPDPPPSWRCSTCTPPTTRWSTWRRWPTPRVVRSADRDRSRRARRRRRQAVRGQPLQRHPRVGRPAARRLAPGHAAAAAHRPRGGRARGPRLRRPGRPAGAGRAGARPPHHPDRRGTAGPADHRRDRLRPRAPAAAADRPHARARPTRVAPATRRPTPSSTRGGDNHAGGAARPHRTWSSLPLRGGRRGAVRAAARREGPAPSGRSCSPSCRCWRPGRSAAADTGWPAPGRWSRTGCRSA